ncbi:MAG: hypothetical protein ACI4TK_05765 [Agathobacter sp.]
MTLLEVLRIMERPSRIIICSRNGTGILSCPVEEVLSDTSLNLGCNVIKISAVEPHRFCVVVDTDTI